jgi:16S rRNA (cytidine1402-2'-O)-methyltransferase
VNRPPAPAAGAAPGQLLLVPNALDHGAEAVPIEEVLPLGVLRRAAALGHWVAENARSARALLKRVDAVVPLGRPLQAIAIHELPRPRKGGAGRADDPAVWRELLAPALAGHDLGLVSEAGLPAVADPGARLVAEAHAAGIRVVPLPGPSALLLALAASGLDGQNFAFVGYLPQGPAERRARILELQADSRRRQQTQLFIETPYRNAALLQALLETLDPGTSLSVGCGLTLPDGWSRCAGVARWRADPTPMPADRPAVFALLA